MRETCVIATRRTARQAAWRLYGDVRLQPQAEGTRVERPALPAPSWLADQVELVDGGQGFLLRGRQADLLEITMAEGHPEIALRMYQEMCNQPDGDGIPAEVGARIDQVLAKLDWKRAARAS